MKKFFYLFTVIAIMFAFTACDSKGDSTTSTSPDDPKSGIEGTWVAVDTIYYNFGVYKEIGWDVVMQEEEYKYTPVYIFKQGKMSVLFYYGVFDGDNFVYYKAFVSSALSGTVDYWMEDGVFYNSLMPEGYKISFLDDKHMQIWDGLILRRVDNIQQTPKQNPLSNTYWVGCNTDDLTKIQGENIKLLRLEDGGNGWETVTQYIDGKFVYEKGGGYERAYIYAPNEKVVYLGMQYYYHSMPMCNFEVDIPIQILQENGATYLEYDTNRVFMYSGGNRVTKIFTKIDETLIYESDEPLPF